MKTKLQKTILGLAALIALSNAEVSNAIDITGGGADLIAPVYAKWAAAYQSSTGVSTRYKTISSGDAIVQMRDKSLDFSVSDVPLKPEVLAEMSLLQFPMVVTGLVPVIHLDGVLPSSFKLDGATLADIYLNKITQWNDPALVALNPGLRLPNKAITVIHRTDASGSTFVFTNYLSKSSSAWRSVIGEGETVAWKSGQVGGKGSEGVAKAVQQIPGSIAYVEYAFAVQYKLDLVQLKNRAGQFVKPDDYAFQAAVMGTEWRTHAYSMLTDSGAKDAWPINTVCFVLMHKVQEDGIRSGKVLKFFDWVFHDNNDLVLQASLIPLPENLMELAQESWRTQLKDSSGKSIWQ